MNHDPLCLMHPSDDPPGVMCSCGLIARVRADERKSEAELVTSLARWKNEATEVLAGWERVYESLGSPGRLGESKAAAALTYVKSWQAVLDAAHIADAARRDALADLRAEVEDVLAAPREFDEWTAGWNSARDTVLLLIDEDAP